MGASEGGLTAVGGYVAAVARGPYTDEQIEAAIEAISDPERFREAERLVARAAPQLQRILAEALAAGGWFGESQEAEVLKAATTPDRGAADRGADAARRGGANGNDGWRRRRLGIGGRTSNSTNRTTED